MVRVHPDPPVEARIGTGGVAQLGEHLLCKQGVIGSIPFTSTNFSRECRQGPEASARAWAGFCCLAAERSVVL